MPLIFLATYRQNWMGEGKSCQLFRDLPLRRLFTPLISNVPFSVLLFLSHFTFLLSNVSKMQMLLSQFSCVVPFLLPLYPRSLNSRAPVSVLLCRSILASPLSKVPNFKCSCFCSPVKFHSYLPFVQSLILNAPFLFSCVVPFLLPLYPRSLISNAPFFALSYFSLCSRSHLSFVSLNLGWKLWPLVLWTWRIFQWTHKSVAYLWEVVSV